MFSGETREIPKPLRVLLGRKCFTYWLVYIYLGGSDVGVQFLYLSLPLTHEDYRDV